MIKLTKAGPIAGLAGFVASVVSIVAFGLQLNAMRGESADQQAALQAQQRSIAALEGQVAAIDKGTATAHDDADKSRRQSAELQLGNDDPVVRISGLQTFLELATAHPADAATLAHRVDALLRSRHSYLGSEISDPTKTQEQDVFTAINTLRGLSGIAAKRGEYPKFDLSRVDAHAASFGAIDLRRSLAQGLDARLTAWRYAHLDNALLVGSDFRCADLYGAHLGGALLRTAHLEGANLGHADLSSADGLTAAMLEHTTWDDATRFPAGFVPPASEPQPGDRRACWAKLTAITAPPVPSSSPVGALIPLPSSPSQ
jgi:hypothetical protein